MGLEMEIIASPRASEIGLRGIVVNETKKTLTIHTPQKRVIEKKGRKLCFNLGRKMATIEGTALVGRPEERMKTKRGRKR